MEPLRCLSPDSTRPGKNRRTHPGNMDCRKRFPNHLKYATRQAKATPIRAGPAMSLRCKSRLSKLKHTPQLTPVSISPDSTWPGKNHGIFPGEGLVVCP